MKQKENRKILQPDMTIKVKKSLDDYQGIEKNSVLKEIRELAESLLNELIVMLNSTPAGGGVSEILNSIVLLMNILGLNVEWRVIKGSDNFFQVTKEFHNGLQGADIELTVRKKKLFEETNHNNALMEHIEKHDLVVVHDPQPLAMIKSFKKRIPWLWRSHVDLSRPNQELLSYLRSFIEHYDAMIVSMPQYRQSRLNIKQIVISPSIDPLSDKNIELDKAVIKGILKSHSISLTKPIIAQVSRFDRWKDPIGVIDVFERVRRKTDCQLVLLGNMAWDDPEGPVIVKEVQKRAGNNPDVRVLVNPQDNDRTVNALQTVASVILQKSIREGFALTVSEAMWKETPVVGTKVGGIPLQVIDKETGFLVEDNEEAAEACLRILTDKEAGKRLGRQAKEHVRRHFLITRHLLDYLRLFDFFLNRQHRFNIGFKYPYNQ